jgi:hypothetical protein
MTEPPGSDSQLTTPPSFPNRPAETTPLARAFGSRHTLFGLVFMLLIFTAAAQPITDPDFWWHLKTGQIIVETRSIPHTDIFSASRFGGEWVAHEWLSEGFMYSVFRLLGFGGLIVVFAVIITAAFRVAYQRCRHLAGHPFVSGFALLLGAAATMPTWGVRPQMFSLLFASIFLSLLDRYARREAMPSLWWLAGLMVLWVNLHAGFALGLVLIMLTAAGFLIDWLVLRAESLPDVWRRVWPLCLLLLVCSAMVCLNPNGLRIYSYPFETLRSQAMMQYIEEWHSPNFHNPLFQALALLLLGTFAALTLSGKRVRPGQILMLAATAWAALRSGRNVPFFAMVAMPLLAEHGWAFIAAHHWDERPALRAQAETSKRPALQLLLGALLLGVILVLLVLGVERAAAKQPAVEAEEFPAAAVNYLRDHQLPQPIFNEYAWGGYLIWKLYPDYHVYIDGRADVYGDDLVKEFLDVNNGRPGWQESLERHGIQTVIVKSDAALASLLQLEAQWQEVFADKQALIFVHR